MAVIGGFRTPRSDSGFTLIELMVVVAIIGILASVALPVFSEQAKKARSTEGPIHVKRLAGAARAHFLDVPPPGQERRFPETEALTPAFTCCAFPAVKCAPDPSLWSDPTWQQLQFTIPSYHYFRVAFESSGTGNNATFVARAQADLDCDTFLSTFEMGGNAAGNWGMYTSLPVE